MSDKVTVKVGDKEYFYFKSEMKVAEEFLKIDLISPYPQEYYEALEEYKFFKDVEEITKYNKNEKSSK